MPKDGLPFPGNIHMHSHIHTRTYIYTHTHTHTHTRMYIHLHTHTHIYTHTCTSTNVYIHMHAHTHTLTDTCNFPTLFYHPSIISFTTLCLSLCDLPYLSFAFLYLLLCCCTSFPQGSPTSLLKHSLECTTSWCGLTVSCRSGSRHTKAWTPLLHPSRTAST